MAKLIPVLVSTILVFSAGVIMVACAGGGGTPAPTAAPAKPAATTPPAAAAPTTAPTTAVAPTTAPTVAAAPTTAPTVAVAPTTAASPAAATTAAAPTTATSPAGTPEVETAGQELFEANCVACHGPNGAGGIKIGSSTSADIRWSGLDPMYKNDEALLRRAILTGEDQDGQDLDSEMPRFQGKLTDQQVTQLIAYLKTLK